MSCCCKRCRKPKSESNPKYLQIIRYQSARSNQLRSEGKFKELQDNVQSIKRDLHNELLGLQHEQQAMSQVQKNQDVKIEEMH